MGLFFGVSFFSASFVVEEMGFWVVEVEVEVGVGEGLV